MSFSCPECSGASTLRIVSLMELPPDSRSDEITLQLVTCTRCGFSAIAVYEESRRGRLNSEAVDHRGYRVSETDLTRLKSLMKRCPNRKDRRCNCRSHLVLGKKDKSGRWCGLADIHLQEPFWLLSG